MKADEFNKPNKTEKIGQEHIHDLLFGEQLSWQSIIYELINTEQLDPWDIDLILLSQKYLEKIQQLEEANFFVSSKVLLAASLLLRIKSEILLEKYIKSIDEILFGKKEDKKPQEKLVLEEGEIPELIPRTPLPRHRKVSLDELMSALSRAINTENRRIKREIRDKMALREATIPLPKKRIPIRERIRRIYALIKTKLKGRTKLSFTELAGKERENRLSVFVPLLYLDTQKKVWLEQEKIFTEIWIWLSKVFEKFKGSQPIIKSELSEQYFDKEKLEQGINPLASFFESFESK